ncbi:hypothetical protein HDU88_004755 [Geranomyces variabilis]|nr:hypothetical protein HDU88_004755 [Geranomyces variabilis]
MVALSHSRRAAHQQPATMLKWAWNVKDWTVSNAEMEALLSYLPERERVRIRAFRFPVDGHRSLMGQILARLAILSYMPDLDRLSDLVIGRTPEGKPVIMFPTSGKGLAFNVSHHGDWVVIAAATTDKSGSAMLGVDVSQVQPPASAESVEEYLESFETFFTETEWSYVHGSRNVPAFDDGPDVPDSMHRFHHLWCLKESYVKALGIGLGMDLERISFNVTAQSASPVKITMALDGEPQNGLHFELSYLDVEHPVAICYELEVPPTDTCPFTVLRWDAIKERIASLGDSRFAAY